MKILKQISNFGVREDQGQALRNRIQLTNHMSLVAMLVVLSLLIHFVYSGEGMVGIVGVSISLLVFITVFLLNRAGKQRAGRILFCVFPVVGIIVVPLLSKIFEPESRDVVNYMSPKILMIVALILPLLLFDFSKLYEQVLMFFLGLVLILGFDLVPEMFGVGIDAAFFNPENYGRSVVLGAVSYAMAFFSLMFLHQKANNYQKQLLVARKLAEEALLAKSTFLSSMSHEIRTPLNGVIGMTELLRGSELTDQQRDQLNVLHYSGKNLLSLVNDILDFSKIEAGKIELEHVELDLRSFAESTLDQFIVPASKKSIMLLLELDENCPDVIYSDPVRLAQILNNLLSNAIKFTKGGTVILRIDHLASTSESARLEITVEDTGVGIPRDKFEHIFESFSQASSATTRNFGGTGLGLMISKNLVEVFGSKLELTSEEGKGTCFYFELQCDIPAPGVSVLTNVSMEEVDLTDYKILVAEDNPMNVMVATGFLQNWGAQVKVVGNGLEAVEACEKEEFDLVLMDLHMPVMNGIDAAKNIRTKDEEIPILALTASPLAKERMEIIEAGMNAIVPKPFDPEELKRKIARYVQKKRAN